MHEVFDLARGFDLAYCSKGFLEIGIWLEGFRPSWMIEVIERVLGQIQPSAKKPMVGSWCCVDGVEWVCHCLAMFFLSLSFPIAGSAG